MERKKKRSGKVTAGVGAGIIADIGFIGGTGRPITFCCEDKLTEASQLECGGV